MPAKNSIKTYLEDNFYHIYNRGIDKREIFLDSQDFGVFLSYLKLYLSPKNEAELIQIISSKENLPKEKDKALKLMTLKNFYSEIELHCYALMTNHFHLLVKQKNSNGIDHFLRCLSIKYSMYFNHKYHRVGPLFQGVYKGVLVESDEQLLHLSRYIHKNPPPLSNLPSSLDDYLGRKTTPWLKKDFILNYFNKNNPNGSYEYFVNGYVDSDVDEIIAPLAIDWETLQGENLRYRRFSP